MVYRWPMQDMFDDLKPAMKQVRLPKIMDYELKPKMKLGANGNRFGTGSTDGLGMFSDMRTYSITLLKEKCWARILVIGKG